MNVNDTVTTDIVAFVRNVGRGLEDLVIGRLVRRSGLDGLDDRSVELFTALREDLLLRDASGEVRRDDGLNGLTSTAHGVTSNTAVRQ